MRLASANPHKLEELRRALPAWEVEALEADGWPAESGETYEENARIKARFARGLAGVDEWVVADDSGVEADALGGRPGIHSARWSGAWVETMLAELDGAQDRRGRYVCVLVAIAPGGEELVARGELAGSFADAPRGSEGFGYDPIFVPEGEERTVAELGNAWKDEHSHRARAALALAALLPGRPGLALASQRPHNRGVGERRVVEEELQVAIEARKELGAELEPAVIDAFVDRIEQRLAQRTDESERALKRKRDHQREMVLGAMGIAVPLLAIAAIFTGLAGVIAVCAAVAVIAIVSAR